MCIRDRSECALKCGFRESSWLNQTRDVSSACSKRLYHKVLNVLLIFWSLQMKKSLIALAVLAASGAAFAQSNVTLYGIADVWFGSVKTDDGRGTSVSTTKLDSGGVSGSRWGVKGSEAVSYTHLDVYKRQQNQVRQFLTRPRPCRAAIAHRTVVSFPPMRFGLPERLFLHR